MKSEGALKHFLIAFLLALVGYAVFYKAIEYRRTRNGPWEVTFTNSPSGRPMIIIDQPALGVSNVQVTFEPPAAASNAARVRFSDPRPVPYDTPFGRCVFMDTTFLPGTVTLELFGHEIELLPRVLVVDRQEHIWRASSEIALRPLPPGMPGGNVRKQMGP